MAVASRSDASDEATSHTLENALEMHVVGSQSDALDEATSHALENTLETYAIGSRSNESDAFSVNLILTVITLHDQRSRLRRIR